jgi:hypothetical protein
LPKRLSLPGAEVLSGKENVSVMEGTRMNKKIVGGLFTIVLFPAAFLVFQHPALSAKS